MQEHIQKYYVGQETTQADDEMVPRLSMLLKDALMSPQPKRGEVSDSPLISNQVTGYINFEGLKTPNHLVSPDEKNEMLSQKIDNLRVQKLF